MNKITTNDIRERFLEFFRAKDHSVIASDSLVPQNDPTLLFTGAGMNQFKEYFLGLKTDLRRAASCQKCLRTGDLEQVGKTPYHHSFFEMLGNFSFGDYFKEDAIRWAWEFLVAELGIPQERLRVSVHKSDEEAFKIWRDKIKLREDWISKMGDDTNFWPANAPEEGPNGPCGPCSEIYFDQGEDPNHPHACSIDHDCGRFAEVWNLVFTQFDRQNEGKLAPLQNKNIDTGMGLERLACVIQGKKSNFEIDIFSDIKRAVARSLGWSEKNGMSTAAESHLFAISDHIRAITFALHDGVIPANEGRGYVIRKLIRRSLWRAHQLLGGGTASQKALRDPFLYQLVPEIGRVMERPYPEILEAQSSISSMLRAEEERFLETLDTGLAILGSRLASIAASGRKELAGETVFELYDTYGFPDELTRAVAQMQGFRIDQTGFNRLMEEQRTRAKQASPIASGIFVSTDLEKKLAGIEPTVFLGYDSLSAPGTVLLAEIKNQKGLIVLDRTPFYAEGGGQVGDQGWLAGAGFKARVADTQKKDQIFLHSVEIIKGSVKAGDPLEASVDLERRRKTMRNHTATHLLHAALRKILGSQVRQLGSLVSPEKLRFDYSYSQALTPDQMKEIENAVNHEILQDTAVTKEEKDIQSAKEEGAIAFFGEKYGKSVRVVSVPGFSKELCGGTHCDRTGQIGVFLITGDSSIGSGTRRIEALTGEGAMDYVRSMRAQVYKLADELKTTPAQLGERIGKLQETVKTLEKQRGQGAAVPEIQKIIDGAQTVDSVNFVAYRQPGLELNDLRHLSDALRSKAKKTVYFLGAESAEKIHFLIGLTPDLEKMNLDAREIMRELTPVLASTGGGRRDFVQGGGRNQGQFRDHWEQIIGLTKEYLSSKRS